MLAASVLLAELVLASRAFAGAARVLLVGAGNDPTVVRLRQELGVLGFEVEELGGDVARSDLGELGRERNAAVVARVTSSPPSVVLWFDPAAVGPAGSGGPTEVTLGAERGHSTESALLALRAIELVRGRLLPVAPPPLGEDEGGAASALERAKDAAADAPAPAVRAAEVVAPAPSEAPWSRAASVFVAPAIVASPGGLPPAPEVLLGGSLRVHGRLELEALALVPTLGSRAQSANGTATLRPGALALGASAELTRPGGRFFVDAGLGLGVALLFFSGEAGAPYVASSGVRAAALPYAHLASGVALGRRVALRLDLLGALVRPEPVLRVAGAEVASFGSPVLGAAFGVEVRP